MKKHLLPLLILSAFVLVGCNTPANTNNEEKPGEVVEDPDKPGEKEEPDTPETPDVPDTPDTPDVPDTPETPEIPEVPEDPWTGETVSYTLDFNSSYVKTGNNNGDSTVFDNTIKSYFNHESEIVANVTTKGYVQVFDVEEESMKAMLIGSKKQDGEINITFTTNLVSVKIYGQAQFSFFERTWGNNQGFVLTNENTTNKITVNTQAWELEQDDEYEHVFQNKEDVVFPPIVEKDFTINSNALTISGEAYERMYIHKIEMKLAKA